MAKKFLTPIDMSKNEIQNVVLQNLASAPNDPGTGQIYLDVAAAANQPTFWNAAAWVQLALRTVNTFLGKQTFAAPSASVSGSVNFPSGSGNTPVTGDLYNLSGILTFHNGTAAKSLAFVDNTLYVGTTSIALNRASSSQTLTGVGIDGNAATATLAGKSTNLVGGNSTTLLGSMPYQSNTDITTQLAPNTTTTKKYLTMTGSGTNGAVPAWAILIDADVPTALTGKTYNGLTITSSTGTLTLTAGKTLTVSNTLTFSGTDGSTLNIGTGGTLGTAAYTDASAYATTATKLSAFAAPIADVAMGGYKLTGLGAPTVDTDGATKGYIDSVVAGLSWKEECRCATTANATLATAYANGQSVDGQTLATGDRILIKDQTAAAENGIYIVQAAGAPVRATDADSDVELKGTAVFVWQGTTNGGTRWVLNTTGTITVNTTPLTFVAFGAGQTYTGSNGVLLTASNFTVQPDTGGTSGLSVASTGVKVDPTVACGAASTYITRRIGFAVGDGSAVAYTLTHNLNTRDAVVAVSRASGAYDVVECDIEMTTVNTVTLRFSVAPTASQFRAVVVG